MFNIPKEALERLRKEYPKGSRVELLHMDDPYSKLKPGDKGTVMGVDDIGTIHVSWDCGSTLGVAYCQDYCRKLDEVTVICCGETKVWNSRTEARQFFLEGMTACEGSERERYAKVLLDLESGKTVCRDTDDSFTRFLRDEVSFRLREFFGKYPDDMNEGEVEAIVDELDNRSDEIFDYDRIDEIIEGMLKKFEEK